MSTKAEAILEEIRALPPKEQREVLIEMQQSRQSGGDVLSGRGASARRGRGLFAGSGLLETLLADRAKERARG